MATYMRLILLTVVAVLQCCSALCQSNWMPRSPQTDKVSSELSVTYSALRSNAPVGGCGCFWMAGGSAAYAIPVRRSVFAVAEVSGEHVGSLPGYGGHGLDLVSVMGGARISDAVRGRYRPFAQGLMGTVYGFDSELPSGGRLESSAFSFALAAGGGLDIALTRRLMVRAAQADYHFMQLPNNGSDEQHGIRLSAGIVYRFLR